MPCSRDNGRSSEPPEIAVEAPEQHAPLFEVCAFELFNHITESATYRRCENKNCGRLFVRQYGRAEHGQSRSEGVKYCSSDCAKAAAARAYRARKKAAKLLESTQERAPKTDQTSLDPAQRQARANPEQAGTKREGKRAPNRG